MYKILVGFGVLVAVGATAATLNVQDLDAQYQQTLSKEFKNADKDQKLPVTATTQEKINLDIPMAQMRSFSSPHHNVKEEFVIQDLEQYELVNKPEFFLFDTTNTASYELEIENKAIINRHREAARLKGDEYFNAELECDGDFKLRADRKVYSASANEKVSFRIYGQLKTRAPISIFKPSANVKSCSLTWGNSQVAKKKFGVQLVLESAYLSKELSKIRSSYQNCILPQVSKDLTGMQRFFLSSSYRQLTCPQAINAIETKADRVDGFNAKVEALLGYSLPKDAIEKQNPYIDLDFSKAPKLDMILVSYLIYQSDFTGKILTRILEWHAKQGTQVRIFVSDVMQGKKNKAMLNELVASSPNVKVKEYRFNAKSKHGTIISQLHRTNHVKILSTVSFSEAKNNITIVGGRNIHDGFLFKDGVDQSQYPELINYYQKGLAYWRDFEVKIQSVRFTHEVVGQFYTLWDQDVNTSYVRSWVQNIPSQKAIALNYFESEKPLIRHYVSTPYVEGRLIQDLYAEMVDHAQKKVLISTPYFRPSKPLVAAFERAIARGVEITLVTRLNLDGDTLGSFLGETNKAGINKFYDKIKVYNYSEDRVILHSKIVLIDDEFSFLGSVNLNRRSFIHDTENALFVYSPAYNQELTRLYEHDYIHLSKEITEKQKQVFWKKILIDLLSDKF